MELTRRSYLKRIVAETVVVHLTNEASVRGVLTAVHDDVLVLWHAAYLNPDGSSIAIDGETLIPRDRVSFYQRLAEVQG